MDGAAAQMLAKRLHLPEVRHRRTTWALFGRAEIVEESLERDHDTLGVVPVAVGAEVDVVSRGESSGSDLSVQERDRAARRIRPFSNVQLRTYTLTFPVSLALLALIA